MGRALQRRARGLRLVWHKTAAEIIEKVRRSRATLSQVKTATRHSRWLVSFSRFNPILASERLLSKNYISAVLDQERPMTLGLAERQGDLLDDVVRFCHEA